MSEELLLEAMEELVRLAKKGKKYDEMNKNYHEKIKELKEEMKKKELDYQNRLGKCHKAIFELKSSHQDYEPHTCKTCNGEGGFTWSDDYGNGDAEVCGDCGGTGTVFINKSGD